MAAGPHSSEIHNFAYKVPASALIPGRSHAKLRCNKKLFIVVIRVTVPYLHSV